VSCQHASGKAITAMIEKSSDGQYIFRLGVVPKASGSICVMDEMQILPFEDQDAMRSTMQEGWFNLNKFAREKKIVAETTIIGTCNPMSSSSTWRDPNRMNKDEIQISAPIKDRFDQFYGFNDEMSREEAKEFADARSRIAKRIPHNYNFLTKYILYAKTIKPVYRPEAEEMIKYFWVKLKLEGIFSNRGFDTLYKMAEAMARLKLSNIIDTKIVSELMISIKLMILQNGKIIEVVEDPRDVAVRLTIDYIKSLSAAITFQAALTDVRKTNDQINFYLGHKRLTPEENWKFREIRDRFLTYTNKSDSEIHITSSKPLTLIYQNNKMESTNEVNEVNEVQKKLVDKKNFNELEDSSIGDQNDGVDSDHIIDPSLARATELLHNLREAYDKQQQQQKEKNE
jgi:hypothetical protein